ncbi:MAG: hypothetical protein RLY31_2099 [Bacteroidota bacterium]|jgi:hypothetical protein
MKVLIPVCLFLSWYLSAGSGILFPGSVSPTAAASDTFRLETPALEVQPDSQVCVPVFADTIDQILSMQFSLHWDPAVLEFRQVTSLSLPSLGRSNFGTHSVRQGTLTFSWYDPQLRGLSRTGRVHCFDLCFRATGAAGSYSDLTVDGSPTVVEIADAAGHILPLVCRNGRVQVR